MDAGTLLKPLFYLLWPEYAPALVALCFGIAIAGWWLRGDVVSAYVFGFSLPFVVIWAGLLVWFGLDIAFSEYPPMLEDLVLWGEGLVAALLFLACSARAHAAMATRTPLTRPARVVSVLIVAVALHFHVLFSTMFNAFQQPLFEMRVLRFAILRHVAGQVVRRSQ